MREPPDSIAVERTNLDGDSLVSCLFVSVKSFGRGQLVSVHSGMGRLDVADREKEQQQVGPRDSSIGPSSKHMKGPTD